MRKFIPVIFICLAANLAFSQNKRDILETLQDIPEEITKDTPAQTLLPASAFTRADSLYGRVGEIIKEGIRRRAFPGAQVLAMKHGKVLYHEVFGYHTYDSLTPQKKTDIYDLASVTKVSAATLALMKLHDQGVFNLDTPAYTYWKPFKRRDKRQMTFRQILAHQAGLRAWIPFWSTTTRKNGKYRNKTLADVSSEDYPVKLADSLYLHKDYHRKIYKMIRKSEVKKDPGYVYSGLSFYLYPQIVEALSGMPFTQFLDTHFYQPLDAGTLTFNPAEKFPLSRIIPTEIDTFFRQQKLHGVVHDEGAAMMNGVSGNAGLFGTAEDLAKVWQMLLNGGSYQGKQFLTPQTIEKFTSCQYCQQGNRRGLGFDKPLIMYDPEKSSVAPQASYRSYGHSGYTGTFAWADPENGLVYIFLSNRVYPSRNNPLIYRLNIRPAIHKVLYELLEEKNL